MEIGPDKTKVMTTQNNPYGLQGEIKIKEAVEILSWIDKKIYRSSYGGIRTSALMTALIYSTFRYACEGWTFTAEIEIIIQALSMACCRRPLTFHIKTTLQMRRFVMQLKSIIISLAETEMAWWHLNSFLHGEDKSTGTVIGTRRRLRRRRDGNTSNNGKD